MVKKKKPKYDLYGFPYWSMNAFKNTVRYAISLYLTDDMNSDALYQC